MGYIDPMVFGLISQIGYLVLFAFVSGFMFFFKPIKRWVNRLLGRPRSRPIVKKEGDPDIIN